jgi:C_GCAxxG_C_C family probable redox protein
MTREEAENEVFQLYQSGFHCAESISKAMIQIFAEDAKNYTPKMATGFGGGIGGTHLETCGALNGGIIALGWLLGRTKPGADRTEVYELAAEYRKKFVEKFGSSHCQTLLNGFGKQENMMRCKKLTAEAAGVLYDLITEIRK